MEVHWLVPWRTGEMPAIGAQRLRLSDAGVVDVGQFRRKLESFHKRLLMLFKSELLLADEDEIADSEIDGAACGVEELELPLGQAGELTFGSGGYRLSGCAEALLDRALTAAEALPLWREVLEAATNEGWPEGELTLLRLAESWTLSGHIVVLLREERFQ